MYVVPAEYEPATAVSVRVEPHAITTLPTTAVTPLSPAALTVTLYVEPLSKVERAANMQAGAERIGLQGAAAGETQVGGNRTGAGDQRPGAPAPNARSLAVPSTITVPDDTLV